MATSPPTRHSTARRVSRRSAKAKGCGQGRECAGETQLAGHERRLQSCEEQCSEPSREDAHRQEEPRSARHPSSLIRRKATAWDNAVQMRVVLQGLPPSVQHRDCTDLCTEVTWLGGDVAHRFGRSVEQDGVNRSLVLERDLRHRRW
jgi:hypothetical protein